MSELVKTIRSAEKIGYEIGEDPEAVISFIVSSIEKELADAEGMNFLSGRVLHEGRPGRIAYKLLCLHFKSENITLSAGLRREIGSNAKKCGIATDEMMEFTKEVVNEVFFNADLNGESRGS